MIFLFRLLIRKLPLSAQLEPVRDFTIDVNLDKSFNKNYSETFKDTTATGNHFGHLSPYVHGGFNVSYIAFNTLFEKYDPNQGFCNLFEIPGLPGDIIKKIGCHK